MAKADSKTAPIMLDEARDVVIAHDVFGGVYQAARSIDSVDGSCSNRRRDAPYGMSLSQQKEPSLFEVSTVGVDLAKNVIQVHAVDTDSKTVLRRQIRRNQFLLFFEIRPGCLIGMEACSGLHHWARRLQELGHEVRAQLAEFDIVIAKGSKRVAELTDKTGALPEVARLPLQALFDQLAGTQARPACVQIMCAKTTPPLWRRRFFVCQGKLAQASPDRRRRNPEAGGTLMLIIIGAFSHIFGKAFQINFPRPALTKPP